MHTTIWVMFSCFPHFFCVQPGVFTYFCNLGDPITMAGKHSQLDSVRTNKHYQEMVSILFQSQGVLGTEEKHYKVITRWAPTSSKWSYIYCIIYYYVYIYYVYIYDMYIYIQYNMYIYIVYPRYVAL